LEPGEDEGYLQPREIESGKPDPKGETTIRILGLNNKTRIERRRDMLNDFRDRKRRIENLTMRINKTAPGTDRDLLRDELKIELQNLSRLLSAEREDLILARQVILPFMKKVIGR
jgi:hypothetical protein